LISWNDYWKTYSTSKAEKWLILERNKILQKYFNIIEGNEKSVIEIGCGFGSNISLLKETLPNCNCFALDNSIEAVNLVKQRIPNTVLADASDTKFDNETFDLVYSSGLMEHFRDEKPLIDEWKRILKPNGIMVTFIPARFSLWQLYQIMHFGNWQHGYEKSYTQKMLIDLFLSNNWKIIDIIGIDPFSMNGFAMKLFNISFQPIWKKSFLKSGYTELCIITKK